MPLLPELWLSEIVGRHLSACTVRTRIMLRRTCRFFHVNLAPLAVDPGTGEFALALGLEIQALVNAHCLSAVGWLLNLDVSMTPFLYAYASVAASWLVRGRKDVFWQMHSAYELRQRNYRNDPSMYLSVIYYAAVESDQPALLAFLLRREDRDALPYYLSVLTLHAISTRSWPSFQWLLAQPLGECESLTGGWGATYNYSIMRTLCIRRARDEGDWRWAHALVAHWKGRDNNRKTAMNKRNRAELKRVTLLLEPHV